ncbi:hypothetical protein KAZ57_00060 [Patescibacteria group bacterium]|nr:hypothetical protein [Patescibacteria group bacterium]
MNDSTFNFRDFLSNRRNVAAVIGLGLVVLLLLFSALNSNAKKNAPLPPPTQPPTPGPTLEPTPLAAVKAHCLGGPMLANADIRAILAQEWTDPSTGITYPPIIPDTKDAFMSSSSYATYGATAANNNTPDFTGVDCVIPGDDFYVYTFLQKNPQFRSRPQHVLFVTRLMLHTWWDLLPAFIEGGYAVETKGGQAFYMPIPKVVELLNHQVNSTTWANAGIVFEDPDYNDNPVNLNATAYGSSTGIAQMAWMASCFANGCTSPVTLDQLPSVVPQLATYVIQQGGQGSSSLGTFNDFMSIGKGIVAFVAFDSAFASVANTNKMSPELAKCVSSSVDVVPTGCNKDNRIVGIALGGSHVARHTYIPLTEIGQLLLDRLKDPRIQVIALQQLGLSTPAVFEFEPPISWMDLTAPVSQKPTNEVYAAMVEQVKAAVEAMTK